MSEFWVSLSGSVFAATVFRYLWFCFEPKLRSSYNGKRLFHKRKIKQFVVAGCLVVAGTTFVLNVAAQCLMKMLNTFLVSLFPAAVSGASGWGFLTVVSSVGAAFLGNLLALTSYQPVLLGDKKTAAEKSADQTSEDQCDDGKYEEIKELTPLLENDAKFRKRATRYVDKGDLPAGDLAEEIFQKRVGEEFDEERVREFRLWTRNVL